MKRLQYNPDVLDALANLSNDEVFTPPKIANQILDMLPVEIRSDPTITILDPASKSGVFLREAAKRFIKWLEKKIPDLQKRIDHIMTEQLFWIAITDLTSLLSRRSLYCSKYAKWKYSITKEFDTEQWNIRWGRTEHTRQNGICIHCGANQSEYDREEWLETHAYRFIHNQTKDIPLLFSNDPNMKFDVIIGNPPYQLNDWGAQASAKPLYHYFVEQAKKLNPRYLTMVIPARWYSGGKGLDDFRKGMLEDLRIKDLHDFLDAKECFPWVEIKWGICYFLWAKDYKWDCLVSSHHQGKIISTERRPLKIEKADSFIRYNEAIPILEKILWFKEKSFSDIVSSRKPFWLSTNFTDFKSKEFLWGVKIYANKKTWWIKENEILLNKKRINHYKILIPKAIWSWDSRSDNIKPILAEPWSCCTETYILVWPTKNIKEAKNIISYIQTCFFHFLVTLIKNTQDATKKVYQFVPIQDFSESRTDEKLYKKYGLTKEEIAFIESMIKPME